MQRLFEITFFLQEFSSHFMATDLFGLYKDVSQNVLFVKETCYLGSYLLYIFTFVENFVRKQNLWFTVNELVGLL